MKKIILTLVIFNSFLLLSASAPSEEFGDFMRNALIVADGVIESGVIDFSQNIANGEFSAASLEVYKIMGKVIKAKIPETDPNVKLAMEMKKTFQEVTGSYARAIQTELHDFATQAALYNVLDDLSSRSKSMNIHIADVMKYNATLDGFVVECRSRDHSPVDLISDFEEKLVKKCRNVSETEIKRYFAIMEFLQPFKFETALTTSLSLKAVTSESTLQNLKNILSSYKGTPSSNIRQIAVTIAATVDDKPFSCPLNYAMFSNICEREQMEVALVIMMNSFNQIAASSLACGSILFDDQHSFKQYVDERYNELWTMKTSINNYYHKLMDAAGPRCNEGIVNDTVTHFPGKKPIESNDYYVLAARIANRLKKQSNPKLKNNIIVSGYNGKNYLVSCLAKKPLCKLNWFADDSVMVFFESHIPSDAPFLENQKYFEANESKIRKVIHDNQYTDNLALINEALKLQNLSLTAPERFQTFLWLEHVESSTPCTFAYAHSTDSVREAYKHLKFQWQDSVFYKCRSFQIFIFP